MSVVWGHAPPPEPLLLHGIVVVNQIFDWSKLSLPPDSALLIVDVQRGFIRDSTAHVPGRIGGLLDQRGREFALTVATRFHNEEGSNYRKLIRWERLAGPPDTDLDDAIERVQTVIDKTTYSAVPHLVPMLTERSISRVFICGIDTDICVLQNASDLFDLGLEPVVISAACGSTAGGRLHDAALDILRRTIGRTQVVDT